MATTPATAPYPIMALGAAPLVTVDEGAAVCALDEVEAVEDASEDVAFDTSTGQVRLKRAVVLNCVPTMPKLGLGVVG